MNGLISVLAKHRIQWSVTSVPRPDGETFYSAWLVVPDVHGAWSSDGHTAIEALQNALDPLMRHARQSGWTIASQDFIETLRRDLGDLSPR